MSEKQLYWCINVVGESVILAVGWGAFHLLAGSNAAPLVPISTPLKIATVGALIAAIATWRTHRHFNRRAQ